MRSSRTCSAALAAALPAALLAACSSTATVVDDAAPADALVAAAPAADGRLAGTPGSVVIVSDPTDPAQGGPRDPVQVEAARVDGDTLRLTVVYGGGCAQHAFRLVGGYAFAESLPVQTGLHLSHDAKGDRCKALVRPTLAFSLVPLAELYRRGYRTPHGTIDIRLAGWGTALRYTF